MTGFMTETSGWDHLDWVTQSHNTIQVNEQQERIEIFFFFFFYRYVTCLWPLQRPVNLLEHTTDLNLYKKRDHVYLVVFL